MMTTYPSLWPDLRKALAKPFDKDTIYWRAGSVSRDRKRAQALPYADPRVYEDRLNEVCGGDWGVSFRPWGDNRIICELTIHGVTRSSTGEENEGFAPGTAAEAQAFKRACSKFGLGRYLYDIPVQWVDFDGERNRLVETPDLPERFLPDKAELTEAAATPERLSPGRAQAMTRELEKLGIVPAEQYRLASVILDRPVNHFSELSEAEAVEVWHVAKRSSQQGDNLFDEVA